jgi:imidazoleglycerol-phosphate dehydratase
MIKSYLKTREVRVEVNLQRGGEIKLITPLSFFNHMLEQFLFHANLGVDLKAEGDIEVDSHHLIEGIGNTLGEAFFKLLKEEGESINRFGYAIIPMEEALAVVALDISGRSFFSFNLKEEIKSQLNEEKSALIEVFFSSFVRKASITLHILLLAGNNSHHMVEAIFKGFGVAIRDALYVREELKSPPSTKGVLL